MYTVDELRELIKDLPGADEVEFTDEIFKAQEVINKAI